MKESIKLGNGVRAVGPSQRAASGRGLPVTRCKRRTACKPIPDPQIAGSSKGLR